MSVEDSRGLRLKCRPLVITPPPTMADIHSSSLYVGGFRRSRIGPYDKFEESGPSCVQFRFVFHPGGTRSTLSLPITRNRCPQRLIRPRTHQLGFPVDLQELRRAAYRRVYRFGALPPAPVAALLRRHTPNSAHRVVRARRPYLINCPRTL
jgi:hypothetical protein